MTMNMTGVIHAPTQPLKVNSHSVKHIFEKYDEIGFLYPAKKKLLAPHFEKITQNWEKLNATEENLLWTIATTEQGKDQENFASIAVWRQSNHGFIAQHLVSSGNPFLSLKVMLRAQEIAEYDYSSEEIKSSQNWFRPNNRYAYRVFASMINKLGNEKASLISFQYLHQALNLVKVAEEHPFAVTEVTSVDDDLIRFVNNQYGEVFMRAEELDQKDIQFDNIGSIYAKYGCIKSRKMLKFLDRKSGKTVGCIIANRSPLGLNFSFLENRAYYIVDLNLPAQEMDQLVQSMNAAIKDTYAGFDLQSIPIVTDKQTAEALKNQGAIFQREYMQSIWLREGFADWYDHIDAFLQRIENRTKKVAV